MNFEILINDLFDVFNTDETIKPSNNKQVLSICNDFENGEWRFNNFQSFIWNNIKETALSYRERKALLIEGEDSVLTQSAKNLRLLETQDDIGRGSEIAEIILYGIMKNHYSAIPIVPKIFYKQNANDNAKGSDSVHIVIESQDSFSLWFGESKFYNSIENARLSSIVDSVKDSLTLTKIKKENSIITNLSDINDFEEISDELREKIKASLSQDQSIDRIKPILNIPILLLYECDVTKTHTHFSDEYKEQIVAYHKERSTAYFKKQVAECSDVDLYSEIKFHIILFPVANKTTIVDRFVTKATIYRS